MWVVVVHSIQDLYGNPAAMVLRHRDCCVFSVMIVVRFVGLVVGVELREVIVGIELPEVMAGVELREVMVGIESPEVMAGVELREVVVGVELPEVMAGAELPEGVVVGVELPEEVVVGVELPEYLGEVRSRDTTQAICPSTSVACHLAKNRSIVPPILESALRHRMVPN